MATGKSAENEPYVIAIHDSQDPAVVESVQVRETVYPGAMIRLIATPSEQRPYWTICLKDGKVIMASNDVFVNANHPDAIEDQGQ